MTPETIIQIIKNEYEIDVSDKSSKRNYSDLRSIYFYLARRYCVDYSLEDIALKVGRLHANAIIMTERFLERVETIGYKELNNKFKRLVSVIEEDYKTDEDVVIALKIQDYSYLSLQKNHRIAVKRVKYLDSEVRRLKKLNLNSAAV